MERHGLRHSGAARRRGLLQQSTSPSRARPGGQRARNARKCSMQLDSSLSPPTRCGGFCAAPGSAAVGLAGCPRRRGHLGLGRRAPCPSVLAAHPCLCDLAATAGHVVPRGFLLGWGSPPCPQGPQARVAPTHATHTHTNETLSELRALGCFAPLGVAHTCGAGSANAYTRSRARADLRTLEVDHSSHAGPIVPCRTRRPDSQAVKCVTVCVDACLDRFLCAAVCVAVRSWVPAQQPHQLCCEGQGLASRMMPSRIGSSCWDMRPMFCVCEVVRGMRPSNASACDSGGGWPAFAIHTPAPKLGECWAQLVRSMPQALCLVAAFCFVRTPGGNVLFLAGTSSHPHLPGQTPAP